VGVKFESFPAGEYSSPWFPAGPGAGWLTSWERRARYHPKATSSSAPAAAPTPIPASAPVGKPEELGSGAPDVVIAAELVIEAELVVVVENVVGVILALLEVAETGWLDVDSEVVAGCWAGC
jgi:hypothetical protein